jgi:hypothetical protein
MASSQLSCSLAASAEEWCHTQDAAKKALQEMFQGKQDYLAAYDAGDGGSGKVRCMLMSALRYSKPC